MTTMYCQVCEGRFHFHNLDCNEPTKVLNETEKPQELLIKKREGHFFKILKKFWLKQCHKCGANVVYNKMLEPDETYRQYTKGDICWICEFCNQPYVTPLTLVQKRIYSE